MYLTFMEVKDFKLQLSRKHPPSLWSNYLLAASRGEMLGIHGVLCVWHSAACLAISLSTTLRASQMFKRHTTGRLGLQGTGGFEKLANLSAPVR